MIYSEEGSVSIEMSIILPFIMLFLIFILSLTIYVFQTSILAIDENNSIQKYANHEDIERKYDETNIFLRKIASSKINLNLKFKFKYALSYFYLSTEEELEIKKKLSIDNKISFLNNVDFIVDNYNIYLKGMWKNNE